MHNNIMTHLTKEKLAQVAEALLEAVDLEATAASQERIADSLEKLNITLQGTAKTLAEPKGSGIDFDGKNVDAVDKKLGTVTDNITDLTLEVKKTNELLMKQIQIQEAQLQKSNERAEKQIKNERLESAIKRAHCFSFPYYADREAFESEVSFDSEHLVKLIMEYFAIGCGYFLPMDAFVHTEKVIWAHDGTAIIGDIDLKKKEFRDKIVDQVSLLIGKAPRVVEGSDGRICLYHP